MTLPTSFRMERQKMDNWCWAAVAVSMARYSDRNSHWRQCEVVRLVLSRLSRKGAKKRPFPDCCAKPVPGECDEPWNLEDALEQVGRPARSSKAGHLSFEKIQAEIKVGRPLCAWIKWRGRGAHFVVVSGCHINRKRVPQVDVEDPDTGEALVNYADFVRKYRGTGRWLHTYLV